MRNRPSLSMFDGEQGRAESNQAEAFRIRFLGEHAEHHRLVLGPVDRRFGCPIQNDPADHRPALAADRHLGRLARLDLDGAPASTGQFVDKAARVLP